MLQIASTCRDRHVFIKFIIHVESEERNYFATNHTLISSTGVYKMIIFDSSVH